MKYEGRSRPTEYAEYGPWFSIPGWALAYCKKAAIDWPHLYQVREVWPLLTEFDRASLRQRILDDTHYR